jgi:DNA replication licensing factor MCM5
MFRQKGAVAVRQPYIRVVGIEQATENSSMGISAFTSDEVCDRFSYCT